MLGDIITHDDYPAIVTDLDEQRVTELIIWHADAGAFVRASAGETRKWWYQFLVLSCCGGRARLEPFARQLYAHLQANGMLAGHTFDQVA